MMGDQPVYKKDWVLTGPAFDKRLACLDADLNEAGRKLLDIRRRLRKFFECNRCPDPDELVDMTIDMEFADMHAATTRVSWWQRVRSVFRIESPAMGLVLATGFMMLIVGVPLVVIQMSKLRSDLKGLRSEQLAQNQREKELDKLLAQQKQQNDELTQSINRERAERGQLEQEVARLREHQAPPPTFALGVGEIERSKGGPPEAMKLAVPRGAEAIKLRLDLLKDQYENYLVVVENAEQHDIWRGLLQATKAGRGKAVVVRLPSRLFVTGQYKLTLSGTNNKREYEVISEFNLDITRK